MSECRFRRDCSVLPRALCNRGCRLSSTLRWLTERNESSRRHTMQRAFFRLLENSVAHVQKQLAAIQTEQEQVRPPHS